MDHACLMLEGWGVKTLRLIEIGRKNILIQISHIQFMSLQTLNLRDNKIKSVFGLSSLEAPQLRTVLLDHNDLTSIKNMRKGYWP
jgi:Leucine-rich repeat (LRR) protein